MDPKMEQEDWAAEGNTMVEKGSDGVWFRLGPEPDENILGGFFGCRCNPVVSIASSILLFGMVVFCLALQPGAFCLKEVPSTKWVLQAGTDKEFVRTDASWTSPTKVGTVGTQTNWTYTVTTLEEKDCYVPKTELRHWMAWVTYTFTWLYIGTQDVWIVFLIVLIFSKYGSMKMGKDSDVPEFTNIEWFAMIFCCGVATGLFFFSCGEPINHYEPCGIPWAPGGPNFATNEMLTKGSYTCLGDSAWANRYSHMSDNERAQHAMTLTFYHWGLHGWVCYAVVGALLGILHWRKGLPMTMKTCFYPLIGKRVYSAWGDVIDSVSIACTTFGVCTSLAMGVAQINEGIRIVRQGRNWFPGSDEYFGMANKNDWFPDWKDRTKDIWELQSDNWKKSNPYDDNGAMAAKIADFLIKTDEKILLVIIITCISTMSITTGLDIGVKWLSIIALVAGLFLLWVINVMDDTFFLLNLFVQTIGHYIQYVTEIGFYTGAFDQPEHAAPDGRQEYRGWMNDWTIFYWGWWISWAPFCGVFLARISKGRTLREFLVTALFITVTYNFFWMNTWGGATLKMEMSAEKAGVQCTDKDAPKYFSTNYCRADPSAIGAGFGRYDGATTYFCSTVTRIGCHGFNYPPMIYDLVMQYGSLGPFLSMIIIISLFLYFITSSDSGSLVDTIVSSNGIEEPCTLQRVYWSLTEGIAACALLYTSNFMIDDPSGSMRALQALSIAGGLPYTVLVCFMCVALWKTLRFESGEEKFYQGFRSSCLDIGITLYSGNENGGVCSCSCFPTFDQSRFIRWAVTCVVPFKLFAEIQPKLEDLQNSVAQKKSDRAVDKRVGFYSLLCSSPMKRYFILAFTAVLFYAGWILVFLDGAYEPTGSYVTRGQMNGTWNLVEKEFSTRYGHFYGTTNEYKTGEKITYPDALTKKEIDREMSMATGDRRGGSALHLAVFGWFFYMFFACVITQVRSSTREALGIPGNIFEDFLSSVFFYPSVLLQVLEVLDHGKKVPDGTGGYLAVEAPAVSTGAPAPAAAAPAAAAPAATPNLAYPKPVEVLPKAAVYSEDQDQSV